MKVLARTGALVIALVLVAPGAVQAGTTRIPFSAETSLIDMPSEGVWSFAGPTTHVEGMVLVYDQVASNPMIDGTITVTVDIVFAEAYGDAMHGTELLQPTAYPGEGWTCSMSGGWDKDAVMQADDRCVGFGEHLAGWQYRSHITAETSVTGYIFYPGS